MVVTALSRPPLPGEQVEQEQQQLELLGIYGREKVRGAFGDGLTENLCPLISNNRWMNYRCRAMDGWMVDGIDRLDEC